MPMPYVGHPIFEQACKAAKLDLTTSYSVDWGQNDILGEAVLAIVEGRDPLTAVKQWRSHEYNIHRAERWVTDEEWEHIA